DLDSTYKKEWKYDKDGIKTLSVFIENCDNLSEALQLYILSCIMEVYYSMNCDNKMIENLKHDLEECVDLCHTRMNTAITAMKANVDNTSQSKKLEKNPNLKDAYNKLTEMHNKLNQKGQLTELRSSIAKALDAPFEEQKYIIHNEDVYYCISNYS
ncbi:MAG: hypothetical protein II664_03850, partial [Oscillospiraceae bacterium]|nr:hypothetical protein [Oscillospiraceae bacterium]